MSAAQLRAVAGAPPLRRRRLDALGRLPSHRRARTIPIAAPARRIHTFETSAVFEVISLACEIFKKIYERVRERQSCGGINIEVRLIQSFLAWLTLFSRNLFSTVLDALSAVAAAVVQWPVVRWLEDCLRQVPSILVSDAIAAALVCVAAYLWRRWLRRVWRCLIDGRTKGGGA